MNNNKKVIAIILCLIMAVGNFSTAFADTSKAIDFEGHWAQATIQKWIDGNRISGYPDGSFKPNANITRAEFVKLVNGLIDYDTKGKIAFNDVKTSDWFYDVVSIAQEIGYISGYSDNQFGPNDNITREQAAAILSRVQYLGENSDVAKEFSDNSKISVWALGSVGAASEAGFVKGYNDESFKPLNNLTRAEAVTMLDNVLVNAKNKVISKAGSELNDYVVEGDLIIAKTVGEGDVHLNNVEVKGSLYVNGGGANSLYFNNLKVAKILVDKDKVRLVLGDGTVVGEILANSESKLENKGGTVTKVTINSDGKVTLSGKFDDVIVESSADIVLKDAVIQKLTVDKAINILGTGTIAELKANANGIQFDSTTKITKTVVGEGVTEKPSVISEGSTNSGTSSGGGSDTPKDYKIQVRAEYYDGLVNHQLPINTGKYLSTSIISDFMISEINEILGSKNTTIDKYLELAENRLKGIKIGETSLYNSDGSLNDVAWDKAFSSLAKTSLAFKDTLIAKKDSLKSDLNDGIDTTDLEKILDLYDVYKSGGTLNATLLQKDLDEITKKLDAKADEITYTGQGTFEVKCVGGTYKGGPITDQEKAVEFIVTNIAFSTKTVDEFFNEFGIITIKVVYGDKNATITIEKTAL